MRLADYMQEEARASAVQEPGVEEELGAELRESLYARVPSERIAELLAQGRGHARRELAASLEQIVLSEDRAGLSASQRDRLIEDTLNMVLGLGPLELLIADPDVTEVMANGPKAVFFERGGTLHPAREVFEDEAQLRLVVDRIVSPLGRRVDEQSPLVNARLPEGHRVNVVIPPLSLGGTALTIRKFREHSFSLAELVSIGTLTDEMADLLDWAVRARKNIAVSGGTGGGKTTLLNALSRQISPDERIVTIEDAAELRFDQHPNLVRLEARPANAEGKGAVTIRELVTNSLRMRPDRIIVGECRGAEAADMLQAMNTGHDGSMTTLHANSPAEVVPRLVMMVRYGMELPAEIIEAQISSALDLVVQQDRMQGGARQITQIALRAEDAVALGQGGDGSGTAGEAGTAERFFAPAVRWDRRLRRYEWLAEPAWLEELCYQGVATAEEVGAWRRSVLCCS